MAKVKKELKRLSAVMKPEAPDRGHTAHLWVRDRHTHAASAGLRGVGAFAGGEAHLNVTRFKQQRSDSPATAYL